MPYVMDGLHSLGHIHTETWHCDDCNLTMQIGNKDKHLATKNHVIKSGAEWTGGIWYCECCRKSYAAYRKNVHSRGKKHLLNSLKEGWN